MGGWELALGDQPLDMGAFLWGEVLGVQPPGLQLLLAAQLGLAGWAGEYALGDQPVDFGADGR
jgi:hypothetical protein